MALIVEANRLSKIFRRPNGTIIQAVQDVSLSIEQGEIFSLLGPNGAGKTTTISMISGLIEPTSGDARIGGYSIRTQAIEAKRLLGVIPQEIALYQELSARRNLEFFGRMYGLGGKNLGQRVDEVLDFIDLKDRQHDRVDTFSGGMKRRVNIGVGLLHRPQLVYMDEPTVGIDPQNRRRILDTVKRLRDEHQMTILYTTHLMEEAQELSDRVGIIDHGRLIALGTQGDLTQQVGEEDLLLFRIDALEMAETTLQALEKIEGINRALFTPPQVTNGTTAPSELTIFAKRGRRALPQAILELDERQIHVLSVEVREPDLEAVFLHLTGRALRD